MHSSLVFSLILAEASEQVRSNNVEKDAVRFVLCRPTGFVTSSTGKRLNTVLEKIHGNNLDGKILDGK